jgi:dihydrolipoamide dehydrogenase
MTRKVDVAIIGAGSAGLSALSVVRRAGLSHVIIQSGEPGTTCARVGCMPSKALIHVADLFHSRHLFARHGIHGADALGLDRAIALEHVRERRDLFVDQVLSGAYDELGDELLEGEARFVGPNTLTVNDEHIEAGRIIIATGTRPVVPAAWQALGERILTTDTLFEQDDLPDQMAVIGLGMIGVELGQALARFGIAVTGIDRLEQIAGLSDPLVNATAVDLLSREFPLWLGAEVSISTESDGRMHIQCGERSVTVDKVLCCMGRRANLEALDLAAAGIACDTRGVPLHDPQTMQVGDLPVFLAGDVSGDRPVLHEANDAGRIAGHNATCDTPAAFQRRTPIAVAFCDPNIAQIGTRWDELDADGCVIGEVRFNNAGRALIMGRNRGLLRLYAARDGRLLGAALAAPDGEHLAHLLALAIERRLTLDELLRMPFYHPVLEETLQGALRDARHKLGLPYAGIELSRKE